MGKITDDTAFMCYILEQEGYFDDRSRTELLEELIERLLACDYERNDPHIQKSICARLGIDSLEDDELEYVEEEVNSHFIGGGNFFFGDIF